MMNRKNAIEWLQNAIRETEQSFELYSEQLQKELTEQREVFELAIKALEKQEKPKEDTRLEWEERTDTGLLDE